MMLGKRLLTWAPRPAASCKALPSAVACCPQMNSAAVFDSG